MTNKVKSLPYKIQVELLRQYSAEIYPTQIRLVALLSVVFLIYMATTTWFQYAKYGNSSLFNPLIGAVVLVVLALAYELFVKKHLIDRNFRKITKDSDVYQFEVDPLRFLEHSSGGQKKEVKIAAVRKLTMTDDYILFSEKGHCRKHFLPHYAFASVEDMNLARRILGGNAR